MTKKAVSRKLEATDRFIQQVVDQTIKKDPVRALVELITNSDDSYKKLEKLGVEHDGKIVIKFKRRRGSARFKVTDHAQGVSSELMDEAVGKLGSETHGFRAGEGGRSFFGRGLKEAILSMGQGFVRSIQNNLYHDCLLNLQKYEREIPKEAIEYYKETLGIPSRGTEVTLVAERRGIKIPQFETLKRSLELHFALRDILSASNREVVLVEQNTDDSIKSEVKLSYVSPKGEIIINEGVPHILRTYSEKNGH